MAIGLRERVRGALDPDRMLQGAMGLMIEAAGVRYALGVDSARWQPGRPLRILLAGYSGTRNTGADVRVEEMIRQFWTIFGEEQLELSILSIDPALSAGYFSHVRQIRMPKVYPRFLAEECPRHHGVIACEGSMFKSKFASALSTMMAGALGLANMEGKPSVGYGAEAGEMDPGLRDFVRKQCKQSLIICRNQPSRRILEGMGIRTRGGTDTAWTFEPAPRERGAGLLTAAGWDGRQPVLAVCPINPFWWPVRPDLLKAFAHRYGGQFNREHYASVYFHSWSEESEGMYDRYLDALAYALKRFNRENDAFTILVGMEQLDRRACEQLGERLPARPPLFVSDEHNMYDLVSILHNCSYMVSSRYHAMVTSMPALVASAGVTMDERIRNLMNDRGHAHLCLEVDEAYLGDKLVEVMRRLVREKELIAGEIARFLPGQLELMGSMGMDLEEEVLRIYPELTRRQAPRTWQSYLPPLSPALSKIMEEGS